MLTSIKVFVQKKFTNESIFRFVIAWVTFRLCIGFVQAFFPINSPHIWRQVDTLATSLRYWMRWTIDSSSMNPFVPAILNSGDTKGIMAMEFPILNVFAAPMFYFGVDAGRILASLLVVVVVGALTFCCFRTWSKVDSKPLSPYAFLLFPTFSFASGFTFKFIPDLISCLLMLLGSAYIWQPNKVSKVFIGIMLMSVAGLMKPVSFVACAIFLLHPRVFRWNLQIWLAGFISLGVSAYYYLVTIPWIRSLEEAVSRFSIEFRSFDTLKTFFAKPILFQIDFFAYHMLAPSLIFFVIVLWFFQKPPLKIIGIVVLQILAVAFLDGKHAFLHAYYFIPTAPFFAEIFLNAWAQSRSAFVKLVLFIVVSLRIFEISFMDLRGVFDSNRPSSKFSECRSLRNKHPEFPWGKGMVFRSNVEAFPLIGLCFGERQDSQKSSFGFFYSDQTIPQNCVQVDQSESFKLVTCSSG